METARYITLIREWNICLCVSAQLTIKTELMVLTVSNPQRNADMDNHLLRFCFWQKERGCSFEFDHIGETDITEDELHQESAAIRDFIALKTIAMPPALEANSSLLG